jgi:hypothetical protein
MTQGRRVWRVWRIHSGQPDLEDRARGQFALHAHLATVRLRRPLPDGQPQPTPIPRRFHGWLVSYVYQPADRFWRFQITETLIYLALTIALLGLTYWWLQRRIR